MYNYMYELIETRILLPLVQVTFYNQEIQFLRLTPKHAAGHRVTGIGITETAMRKSGVFQDLNCFDKGKGTILAGGWMPANGYSAYSPKSYNSSSWGPSTKPVGCSDCIYWVSNLHTPYCNPGPNIIVVI